MSRNLDPDEYNHYLIGVTVGRRPPVLQVSLPVFGHVPGYSDGAAAISNASREIVNRRRLMETSQPTLVVFALHFIIHIKLTQTL